MHWLINTGIVILTFCLMEGVTWLTHKYVMHGFAWFLHADHHDPAHDAALERNDSFFLVFAALSMVFFACGTFVAGLAFMTFIGIGITLYGLAYFLVHDIFIHQRVPPWLKHTDNFYFRALRKAHKMHHKHLDKEEGECFGMLWVPMKYFREALKAKT